MSEVTKFVGTVVERSANGSGIVEMSSPGLEHKAGLFSYHVIHTPEVSRIAQVGRTVEGLAVPVGDNYKIIRIEAK